jgi:hypothetical protein
VIAVPVLQHEWSQEVDELAGTIYAAKIRIDLEPRLLSPKADRRNINMAKNGNISHEIKLSDASMGASGQEFMCKTEISAMMYLRHILQGGPREEQDPDPPPLPS